jgi:hypothetical protein
MACVIRGQPSSAARCLSILDHFAKKSKKRESCASRFSVAVLVLFPTPTRAWLVPAHFVGLRRSVDPGYEIDLPARRATERKVVLANNVHADKRIDASVCPGVANSRSFLFRRREALPTK